MFMSSVKMSSCRMRFAPLVLASHIIDLHCQIGEDVELAKKGGASMCAHSILAPRLVQRCRRAPENLSLTSAASQW